MTPRKKAESMFLNCPIVELGDDKGIVKNELSIQALKNVLCFTVDECIESTKQLIHDYTKGDDKKYADIYLSMSLSVAYWQEVKQEIQKI